MSTVWALAGTGWLPLGLIGLVIVAIIALAAWVRRLARKVSAWGRAFSILGKATGVQPWPPEPPASDTKVP